MKKSSKAVSRTEKPALTVGLDIGDKFSRYCVLNGAGEVMEEGRVKTEASALRRHFEGQPRMRIAMECGTHSPWISRLLQALGHEAIVANARKIKAITGSESKNDRNDAEQLARLAHFDPRLLFAVHHRSAAAARSNVDPGAGHVGTGPDDDHQHRAWSGQE